MGELRPRSRRESAEETLSGPDEEYVELLSLLDADALMRRMVAALPGLAATEDHGLALLLIRRRRSDHSG